MANAPVRSPLEELGEAIQTLSRLRVVHRMHPTIDTMISWLEAEMAFVLDPLGAVTVLPPRPTRRPRDRR